MKEEGTLEKELKQCEKAFKLSEHVECQYHAYRIIFNRTKIVNSITSEFISKATNTAKMLTAIKKNYAILSKINTRTFIKSLFTLIIDINNQIYDNYFYYRDNQPRATIEIQSNIVLLYKEVITLIKNNNYSLSIEEVNTINYVYSTLEINLATIANELTGSSNKQLIIKTMNTARRRLENLMEIKPSRMYRDTLLSVLIKLDKRDDMQELLQSYPDYILDKSPNGIESVMYKKLLKKKFKLVLY